MNREPAFTVLETGRRRVCNSETRSLSYPDPTSDGPPLTATGSKRSALLIALLLLLFLGSRVAVLLGSTAIYHDEEEFRGTVAKELIEGNRFSLFDYQYTAYEGGSILAILLVTPFYRLFGANVYALKAAGLLIGVGVFLSVVLLLRRYAGRRAAVLGALVMVLAPPYFVRRNLMTMGDFDLSMLATLLVLAAFCRVFLAGRTKPAVLAGFGFLSGAAVWVHYSSAVMVAACSFLLVFRLRDIRWKGVAAAVGGAVVGALPLIYYNVAYRSGGAFRLKEGIAYGSDATGAVLRTLASAGELAARHLAMSYQFLPAGTVLSAPVLAYAYYAGFVALAGVALAAVVGGYRRSEGEDRRRLGLTLAALVYLGFYALAYSMTRYRYAMAWDNLTPQSASYLFHFFTALFLIAPLGAEHLLVRPEGRGAGARRVAAALVLTVLLACGAIGYVTLIDSSPGDPDRKIGEPFSRRHLAYMLGENFFDDPDRGARIYPKFTDEERRQFARGIGSKQASRGMNAVPPFLTPDERLYFITGRGQAYYADRVVRDREPGGFGAAVRGLSALERAYFLEGVWDAAAEDRDLEKLPPRLFDDLLLTEDGLRDTRARLADQIGLASFDRTRGFAVRSFGVIADERYVIEKVALDLPLGIRVPLNVYRPIDAGERRPAVLVIQSHDADGKAQPGVQATCQTLAKAGFVAVSYDWAGYGEREAAGHEPEAFFLLQAGLPMRGMEVWEARAVVDYLVSRPDVDPARIGATGFSGGGTLALFLAALDPRIAAVVVANGFTSAPTLRLTAAEQFWCNFFPGMSGSLDMGDVLGMIAPRPVRLIAGTFDPVFPIEGVRPVAAKGRLYYCYRHYACRGLDLQTVGLFHEFPPASREKGYAWFAAELGQGGGTIAEEGIRVRSPAELACETEPRPRALSDLARELLPRSRGAFAGPPMTVATVRERLRAILVPAPAGSGPDDCAPFADAGLAARMAREIRPAAPAADRRALVLLVGRIDAKALDGTVRELELRGYSSWPIGPIATDERIDPTYFQAKRQVMDGDSPVFARARAIASAICATQTRADAYPNVYVWATGWDGVPAVMAADVVQRLRGMVLDGFPATLDEAAWYPDRPIDTYYLLFPMPGFLPGIDVGELLLPFAPQSVHLTRGRLAGTPEVAALLDDLVVRTRAAYAAHGAAANFTVGPGGLDDVIGRLDTWH
jgi:4-amino-4-deoxy-L-arabinose transferase-like glycosyltransferase/predicted esterase